MAMKRLKPLLVLGLATGIAACSTPHVGAHTGFVGDRAGLAPKAGQQAVKDPQFKIPNAGKAIVVIYNHGTARPQVRENCGAYFNRVPETLLALRKDGVLVYRLCSRATERTGPERAGTYIYRRMAEVEATIRQLRRAGVQPSRLFVASHSAGGWTALMLKARQPALFNAVIAFAPAFAGPRAEENRYPHWRKQARPRQIREMTRARTLHALIFAYENDPFNRPQDLQFLPTRYPGQVTLVGYPCEAARKHLILHYDCRATKTTERIRAYIKARVAAGIGK